MEPETFHQDKPPRKRLRSDHTSPGAQREVGLMKRGVDHSTATFVGSGSGIHFVQSVYRALGSDQQHPQAEKQSAAIPGEDDQLPALALNSDQRRMWKSGEITVARSGPSQVSYDRLLTWSSSYWDHWHAALPFLHAPTVLQWFDRLGSNSSHHPAQQVDPLKLAIVRSIFSISLADKRQTPDEATPLPIPSYLLFDTFEGAVASIHNAFVLRPSIEGLQAAIAVQLFLVSMLRHNAASRVGGLINRLVCQMGLHRCPIRYSTFDEEEITLRKRIFWSAYCLDRHITQSLGLPLGLRDDDIDVCYLNMELHIDKPAPMDKRLALLHFLSQAFMIKGTIVELCNKSINHRRLNPDTAVLITSQMEKLGNDIENFVDTSNKEHMFSDLHTTVLKVLRHECSIALNRPLLAKAKDDPSYKHGLQACIGASRNIIHLLQAQRDDTVQLPLVWPSFTWAVWMSSFIVVYAAMQGEMPLGAAQILVPKSVSILKKLSQRGSLWPNACAAAVQDLSTRMRESSESRATSNEEDGNVPGSSASNNNPERQQDMTEHADLMADLPPTLPMNSTNAQWPLIDSSNDGSLFEGFEIPFWMADDDLSALWSEGPS